MHKFLVVLRNVGLALAIVLTGVEAAEAAPDIEVLHVVTQPQGAFTALKRAQVYLEGNPDDPFPADGLNTFVYTLTNCTAAITECGGVTSPLPLVGFKVEIPDALAAAGIGTLGGGVLADSPGALVGTSVEWAFTNTPISPGQTSEGLYITSSYGPGAGTDNIITVDGALNFDADDTCVGPRIPPPSCELEIDKTCCIPKPAKPSDQTDICDGKAVRMVFEVTGGECGDSTNNQHGKAHCMGHDPIVDPGSDVVTVTVTKYASKIQVNGQYSPVVVDLGTSNTLEFTSTYGGHLLRDLRFKIQGPGGKQYLKIRTSCYKALRCDDQFGALRLVEVESTGLGTVSCNDTGIQTETNCASPSGGLGTLCDNKLTEAVFRFNPSDCQNPLPNPQGGWADCNGDASDSHLPVSVVYAGHRHAKVKVSPNAGIQPGDTFRVSAVGWWNLPDYLKLLIQDDDSVEQSIKLKTSCGPPLACGDVFGSLELVGFTTKSGTEVSCETAPPPVFADSCEVPVAPPKPHCTGSLEEIQLVYLGDLFGADCSVSNDQGGDASCTGDNLSADDVSVTLGTSGVEVDPASGIDIRSLFSLRPSSSWLPLPTGVELTATDGDGNTQTVYLRTDCEKSLDLGDRFGDFVVFGLDRGDGDHHGDHWGCDSDDDSDSDDDAYGSAEDGLITLGGLVEYQYKVTNPGTNPNSVTVDVVDDPNAADADPTTIPVGSTTLAPGEMHTFYMTRTLYESTTNEASVTGSDDVSGDQCTMDVDQVPVTVVLPPTGSFDCYKAKPIKKLSMKWNGTQDVCVVAYKGDVGGVVQKTEDNIQPGDVITVGGLGGYPWTQQWEIFAAGDCGGTSLGVSEFEIACHDSSMNGVEDCGKQEGDGKYDDPSLINDWLLEGMEGDESLTCTPQVIQQGGGGWCGLGSELVLVLPPLVWFATRRRRKAE
jgi:hypothetical protein